MATAAQLKALRKKHGLGEFSKKAARKQRTRGSRGARNAGTAVERPINLDAWFSVT